MLMPCRSFDNGSEDVVIHCHHGGGDEEENSGEDVWSDEDNVEEDQYTQLADFTGKFLNLILYYNLTLLGE